MKIFALVLLTLLGQETAVEQAFDGDSTDWPKEVRVGESQITIFSPQIESLEGDQIHARAALAVSNAGQTEAVYGGMEFEARLIIDRDRRTAVPVDLRVTDARFPQASDDVQNRLRGALAAEIPQWRMTLSLDDVLAEVAALDRKPVTVENLKTDPPEILMRTHPAVLVQFDGEPAWRPLEGTAFRRALNSAFFVIQDPSQRFYLHIPPYWWTSTSPLEHWQPMDTPPPQAVSAWEAEPKPTLPLTGDAGGIERPEVIVTTKPAELLTIDGQPDFGPIVGTGLVYVKNTDRDLFLEVGSRQYYVLLSGRWYKKPVDEGDWTYVPPTELPGAFSRIPPDHEKGDVLACVAGTPQAHEALLEAEIPQTAAIAPGPAPDLNVTYDGEPDFSVIEDVPVRYAINTPYSVFVTGGRFYCCQDGVWYQSTVATGRWSVCLAVPPPIYRIPPSCPHYYVTYCRVFGVTPNAVYVGYYPGYRGCYVAGPTVVYGTGWHYPAWHGSSWYSRPVTWGVGVRYNPAVSAWCFRPGASGPVAWLGVNRPPLAERAPAYPVGVGGWWGGNPRVTDVHHNLRFAVRPSQEPVHNVYARRPERLAPRAPTRVAPAVPRREPNRVFTDREGNTFRRELQGSWKERSPRGWTPPAREVPDRREELDRANRAREEGDRRREEMQRRTPTPPQPPPHRPPPPPDPRPPDRARQAERAPAPAIPRLLDRARQNFQQRIPPRRPPAPPPPDRRDRDRK